MKKNIKEEVATTNKAKKKVVIMGLIGLHNFGDNFIANCMKYLVDQTGDFDINLADLEPRLSLFKTFAYRCIYLISKLIHNNQNRAKFINKTVKFKYKKIYEKALNGADALIFGCGSFKYGTQKLWAYYSLATDIANQKSIPVMFGPMNVQKYDDCNWKCCYLRDHANLPCVKMITSRDGYYGVEKLYKDYKIRSDVVCKGAGDCAFWIPECYHIYKKNNRMVIGINLIDGSIFKRYGKTLNENDLLEIYSIVLQILDRENIPWELFTNGLPKDYKFGEKLLKSYVGSPKKIYTPAYDAELIEKISSYKIVLGARLHACICAYALNIPFIGFIWDDKIESFAKLIKMESHFLEEKNLTGEKLGKLLVKIYKNEEIPDLKIKEKLMNSTKNAVGEFLEKL